MNFKRNVVIFAILVCIFFSISAVVAIDDADANVTAYENQEIGDASEDLIAYSQEDLISDNNAQEVSVSNSNKGTFTELQKLIDESPIGSTITLEKDYSYDDGFNKGQGVVIAKNLTINGNGHTLDGKSKSRILFALFGLDVNTKITLNDITFKNGFTRLYGGAIFSFADLTVNKCTFTKNSANTTAGAICSIGSLKCKNSVFTNNIANGDAGAVFSLNFENSVSFFNNYFNNISWEAIYSIGWENIPALFDGSIVKNLMGNVSIKPATDYITNCKFTSNRASGYGGGAVYAYTHIKIVSSKFTSNKVNGRGGAVYAAKNLYLKDSKFESNQAGKYGGAVFFKFHELTGSYDKTGHWQSSVKYYSSTIEKCTFTKNIAKKRGGAIYGFKYADKPKADAVKPVNCKFYDNIAPQGKEVYGGSLKNCVVKNTKLTIKKVKVRKYASKLVLTATLKKASSPLKNKKITFTFNGKKYTAKTNSKGIAKVTIKSSVLRKLSAGGQATYRASYDAGFHVFSTSKTVTVSN